MSTEPTAKKILIIDDDAAITKLLGGVLMHQGYAVLISMTFGWHRSKLGRKIRT